MRKIIICAFIALMLAISCNGQEFKIVGIFTPQVKFEKNHHPEMEWPVLVGPSVSFMNEKLVVTPTYNIFQNAIWSFVEYEVSEKHKINTYVLFEKYFEEGDDDYVGIGLSKSIFRHNIYGFIEVGSPTYGLHPEFFVGVTLQIFKKFGKKKEHH